MRFIDWSSDVCSSDLLILPALAHRETVEGSTWQSAAACLGVRSSVFLCVAATEVSGEVSGEGSSVVCCDGGRSAPWMTSSSIWRRCPPCSGGRWSFSADEDFFSDGLLRGAMSLSSEERRVWKERVST